MPETRTLPRFSHSQLMTYMDCGEKWRLTRHYGFEDSISWALVAGSAFHSWTEVYDAGLPVEPEYFRELLDQKVRADLESDRNSAKTEADIKTTGRKSKEWPNKRDRAWWEHHGPIFAQQYIDWRHDPENEVMPQGSEYEVERKVSGTIGGLEVVGYIDRIVWDGPAGAPLILDVKTGQAPTNIIQMGAYKVLLEEELGVEIPFASYYLAEQGEVDRIHSLAPFSREYLDSVYAQAARGIEAGVFLPNPKSYCGTCPVKQYCGLYGNRPPLMSGVPLLEDPIN